MLLLIIKLYLRFNKNYHLKFTFSISFLFITLDITSLNALFLFLNVPIFVFVSILYQLTIISWLISYIYSINNKISTIYIYSFDVRNYITILFGLL